MLMSLDSFMGGPKKEPAKKEPAKKEPAKKEPAKKEPAKKEPAKKEPEKKKPAKKAAAKPRKKPPKKTAAKKKSTKPKSAPEDEEMGEETGELENEEGAGDIVEPAKRAKPKEIEVVSLKGAGLTKYRLACDSCKFKKDVLVAGELKAHHKICKKCGQEMRIVKKG
jgi:hypothetical protein